MDMMSLWTHLVGRIRIVGRITLASWNKIYSWIVGRRPDVLPYITTLM